MALELPIRYGGTFIGDEERAITHQALDRSFDTGQWQTAYEAEALEREAAQYLGVKHAVITTSGSAAGLLALAALELPKGSEVIIPAVTFPTIFNIILQCGLKPVVVDCEVGTYNLNLDKVRQAVSPKTKLIIAVHAVGNPADMQNLMAFAKPLGIKVMEDNCDGFGGKIHGKPVGSFGDISITSTHAAHIFSTAGTGGMVFTNDEELAVKVRMYRDWGRQANTKEPNKWPKLPKDYNPRFIYEKIGYNFQILELQAAMGRVQLRKVEEIKRLRKANYEYFIDELSQFDDIILPKVVDGADPCWFALPLSVKKDRASLVEKLEARQIETRSMFAGNIIKHPAYKGMRFKHTDLSGADEILKKSFWISVHPRLSQEDREYVVNAFKDYYAQTS